MRLILSIGPHLGREISASRVDIGTDYINLRMTFQRLECSQSAKHLQSHGRDNS